MKYDTYLKNRGIFESRFVPNEFNQCYIDDMKKGIKNFELFLSLYGHDRRIILSHNTYGVDRKKRYKIPFKNQIGTKISIVNFERSLFEKYPDSFDRLLNQIKINESKNNK